MPAGRVIAFKYEAILAILKAELDKLSPFHGEEFVDEDWSTLCEATVREPRPTCRDSPEEEAPALIEACRPGFALLREAGIDYDM